MERPDAILFDLDGTLIDPSDATLEEDWRASCQACCDGSFEVEQLLPHIHAVRMGFWTDAERAQRGRLDLDWARTTIVRDAFALAGIADDARAAAIGRDYFDRREAAMSLFPSSIETLTAIRAQEIRTALITNGSAAGQRAKVERFGLSSYFDCIVIEGEFGCGKPDERVFRHALQALGCAPERAWMIGDYYEADIETPHRLGMHTVWISPTMGAPEGAAVQPHRTIASIGELLAHTGDRWG